MVNIDFSPLFRSSIGFDRLSQLMENTLQKAEPTYPPYNIEKTREETYRITLAVAGFDRSDLDIVVQENRLVIAGRPSDKAQEKDEKTQYLYHGIAGRAFRHTFELADTIRVSGAELVNGLLHVDLLREIPERAKPRQIVISTGSDTTAPARDIKAA